MYRRWNLSDLLSLMGLVTAILAIIITIFLEETRCYIFNRDNSCEDIGETPGKQDTEEESGEPTIDIPRLVPHTDTSERKIEIFKPKRETSVEEPQIPEVVIQTTPVSTPQATNKSPVLATGISKRQLVTTLGKPTSEKTDGRDNSRVLEYRDIDTSHVNLRYKYNSLGYIYETEVTLNSSVSLGEMQTTLDKLLAGNNSAAVKDKLRAVYNRRSPFSFFNEGDLGGKILRDSKDRIRISVWESN